MSAMWRITWFSSRIPLPPSRSRASAMTCRALRVLLSFASPAIVSLSRPASASRAELQAVELHPGHLREHLHQPVLDDLEAAQRPAELLALLGVPERRVVRGDGVAQRRPRARRARAHQHASGVLERVGFRAAGSRSGTRTPSSWMFACQTARRALALDHRRRVARRVRLNEERLHLAVLERPGPDDHHVGDRSVADPALGAVEHPFVAVPPGGCLERHRVRAVLRLGQRERADLLEPRHRPGSHRCFCSSEPSIAIVFIASPAWTPRNVPRLPSPRWSSMCTSPHASGLSPGAPVALDVRRRPGRARPGAVRSGHGNSARSQ